MTNIKLCLFVIASAFLLVIGNCYSQSGTYNSFIIKTKPNISVKTILKNNNFEKIQSKIVFEKMISGFSKNNKNSLLSKEQSSKLDNIKDYSVISIPNDYSEYEVIAKLRKDPNIISIEPNYIIHLDSDKAKQNKLLSNDAYYSMQWGLPFVNAEGAWKKASGQGIRVGIIDTGIDYTHPDLIDNLYVAPKEDINHNGKFDNWNSDVTINNVTGDFNGVDDDNNGYIDDIIGYDFVDQTVGNVGDAFTPDPDPMDENGHGTYVSGIIAAKQNNNIGISGLAYNSKIVMLRAFDATGNAEMDDIASAFVYAALNGIRVINCSFGDVYNSSIMRDAIKFAYSMNCFISASAGNEGSYSPHYPSGYPEVFSVGWIDDTGDRDYQSNYGSQLCLTAPGTSIYTTKLGGGYKYVNGTSMSSPFVAATAALMLELDSTLTPAEIAGILQATATDAGDNKWDIYYGAGYLNAEAAVNAVGKSNFMITYPDMNQELNKDDVSAIPIIGSAVTPLFDSYQIFIGKGLLPSVWDTVSNVIYKQVKNDTLATIDISQLKDTIYNIRLLINLKNKNTIEKRTRIVVSSEDTPLEIQVVNQCDAYFNNKRIKIISAVTNRNAELNIQYRPKGSSEDYKQITETNLLDNCHVIRLTDDILTPGLEYEGKINVISTNGQSAERSIFFTLSSDAFPDPDGIFSEKSYSLPMSYFINDVSGLYNDGNPAIVVNDVSDTYFGNTDIYQFKDGTFIKRDSLTESWLPAGTGESNADGIKEIFLTGNGQGKLYQANTSGGNPFSRILFSDEYRQNFNGIMMYDINKDGKSDIIAHSDSAFDVYSYINGNYQLLASAYPNPGKKQIGTLEGAALGDFDGDGNNELCHADDRGNIYIWKYNNGKFSLVFKDTSQYTNSAQFITSGDIDADGKPEIIILGCGSKPLFSVDDPAESIWTISILKSITANDYSITRDYIYGVRIGYITSLGFSYRNGITTGNVDNDNAAEIIINTFPNLYVFKWDAINMKLKPFWYYNNVFSNSALVYDFDKNGTNEIGFNTYDNMAFYEYNSNFKGPNQPTALDGWALNENSAYLTWRASANAEHYNIYQVTQLGSQYFLTLLAETTSTTYSFDNLDNNTWYQYIVSSINTTMSDTESAYTNPVKIFTHKPLEVKSAVQKNSRTLLISFDGKLPIPEVEVSNFNFKIDNTDIIIPLTAITAADSVSVLTFNQDLPIGEHDITISSFNDYYKTPTISKTISLNIEGNSNEKELFLKNLTILSKYQFILEYSEEVDKVTSELISNYNLQPIGTIESVTLNSQDKTKVTINLSKDKPIGAYGKLYSLTVSNVSALSGNLMTKGAGNTLSFVFSENNLDNAFVYPDPIHLSDNPTVYFANLTTYCEVEIYNLNKVLLRTLYSRDGTGGVIWDLKDNNGNGLSTGVYIFKAKNIDPLSSGEESSLKKFAIIK